MAELCDTAAPCCRPSTAHTAKASTTSAPRVTHTAAERRRTGRFCCVLPPEPDGLARPPAEVERDCLKFFESDILLRTGERRQNIQRLIDDRAIIAAPECDQICVIRFVQHGRSHFYGPQRHVR